MFFEENVALLEFFEFLDGIDIDGAHGIEALGEFGDEFLHVIPRNPLALAGHGDWLGG